MAARSSTHSATATGTAMRRAWPLFLGALVLALVWRGSMPGEAVTSFSAHMTMHMAIVAVAAPLFALGLSRLFPDIVGRIPPALAILASLAELIVVWGWHAPAIHDAARLDTRLFILEQASFLLVGLLVWTSAISVGGQAGRASRAAGVASLLLTSMHMTLLGALLLLSPRPLYGCSDICSATGSASALADQQLGGVIMLIVGGLAYLAGGLALLASLLKDEGVLSREGLVR